MTAPGPVPRATICTIDPDDERHGTSRGYRKGCRCVPCRDAKRGPAADVRRTPLGYLGPDDILTHGRWVPADGIMRWVGAK